MSALDDQFYDYPDGDLADLRYRYVHANRNQIGVHEDFWKAWLFVAKNCRIGLPFESLILNFS